MWLSKSAAVLSVVFLSACGTPLLKYQTDRNAIVQTTLTQAGITDGRATFRLAFCDLVTRELKGPDANCEQWLTTLADDPAALGEAPPIASAVRPALDIVLVGGIFGECLNGKITLLGDGISFLQQQGYQTTYAPVRGRAGSEENAKIIRDHILKRGQTNPGRRIIIVSYSKGTADTVTALANFPELSGQVVAVVSLAGVVNGSPLADYVSGFYSDSIAKLPYSRCPIIDKLEMDSISRAERNRWLGRKALPPSVLYFSIVAIPAQNRVSALLRPFYDRLSYVDPLNDGQVIFYDAVLPGSTLLAYVNADHWAIALPFETTNSPLTRTLIDKNHFPRAQMLRAALIAVEMQLSKATPP